MINESTLRGMDSLESLYSSKQDFLVNSSMAAVISLRSMPDVLTTGRDIHILGQHSIEFTADLLTATAHEKDDNYAALLDKLLELQPKQTKEDFQSFMLLYVNGICSYYERNAQWTYLERLHMRDNLSPATTALRTLFGRHIDGLLDSSRLLHEGGELEGLDQLLYADFIDPFYLDGQEPSAQPERGLTGHTRAKLLLDARVLGKLVTNGMFND